MCRYMFLWGSGPSCLALAAHATMAVQEFHSADLSHLIRADRRQHEHHGAKVDAGGRHVQREVCRCYVCHEGSHPASAVEGVRPHNVDSGRGQITAIDVQLRIDCQKGKGGVADSAAHLQGWDEL